MAEAFAEIGVGEVIGGYRLERLIGAGSTSQVFLGTHVRLGRPAAIKVLSPALLDNRDVVSRLLTEARVVNDVRHPNIIDIIDFVETEAPPRVALVMEYIEGPSLKALRDYPLTYEQALGISLQLIVAVQAAHDAGVIHRDIKPDNLLLTRDPRNDPSRKVPRLKIVDFGIAKLAGTSGKTMTGMMLGTPAYMAPEQVAGRPPPSTATDVFAIGEVIYELVAGKRAYPAVAIHETVRAKLRGELPPLELPPVPGDRILLALITRCLALRPQDRPALSEVRDTILSLAPEPARPKRESASIAKLIEPQTSQWLESLQDDLAATVSPLEGERGAPSGSAKSPRADTAKPAPKPDPAMLATVRPDAPKTDEVTSPPEIAVITSELVHAPTELASARVVETAELAVPALPPLAATELYARIPVDHSSPTNRVMEALTDLGPLPPGALGPAKELAIDRQAETRTSYDAQALTPDGGGLTGFDRPTIELAIEEPRARGAARDLGAELLRPIAISRHDDELLALVSADTRAATPPKRDAKPELPVLAAAAALGQPSATSNGAAPATSSPAATPSPTSGAAGPVLTTPASVPSSQRLAKPRPKRGLMIAIGTLWLFATVLIAVAVWMDEPLPAPVPKPGEPTRAELPQVVARGLVVRSVPSGAQVEDPATGQVLGRTPLTLDRAKAPSRVRLTLDGYTEQIVEVPANDLIVPLAKTPK
ncbi:protein kinase [Myxococcota bacterium]|nr:protein kinase [Myxococcota bacterium]